MTRIIEKRWLLFVIAIAIVVIWYSGSAFAAENPTNKAVLDEVINKFKGETSKWAFFLQKHAKWLFWMLASISCILRFAPLMLSSAKTDFGDLMREVFWWILGTFFFYWLLLIACVEGGGSLVETIIKSFIKLGSGASGGGSVESFSPSGIVSLGLKLMFEATKSLSYTNFGTNLTLAIASLMTFIVLCLIAAKMTVVLIGAWFTAYAGLFLLGFGGSHLTKDTALSYLKGCLAVGVKVMVLCLLVGFGQNYLTNLSNQVLAGDTVTATTYTPANTASFALSIPTNIIPAPDIWVVLAVSVILFILVSEVPDTVSGFVSGFGGVHSLGSSVSAGAMMYQASRVAAMASAGSGNIVGAGAALTSSVIQAREQNAANEGLFKGSSGAGAKTLSGGFAQAIGTAGAGGALAFGVRTAGSVAKNLFSGAAGAVSDKGAQSTIGGVNQVIKMNTAKEANNRAVASSGGTGPVVQKVDNTKEAAAKTGSISAGSSTTANTTVNSPSATPAAATAKVAAPEVFGQDTGKVIENNYKESVKSELNPTANVGTLENASAAKVNNEQKHVESSAFTSVNSNSSMTGFKNSTTSELSPTANADSLMNASTIKVNNEPLQVESPISTSTNGATAMSAQVESIDQSSYAISNENTEKTNGEK